MKLICIDVDQCGFYLKINKLENQEHNFVCPSCFGPAIEVPNNYNPLVEIKPNTPEEEEKLAKIHNTFNHIAQKLSEEIKKEDK